MTSTAATSRVLNKEDGPLVWVDCEMTGLELGKDRIIEMAVIVTDGDLNPLDEGIEYVIKTPKSVLDQMGPWCVEQHGKTGLTQQCIDSPYTLDFVTGEVLKYIKERVPEKGAALLAGNSVHADLGFLKIEMREVVEWLHYRIIDVSSVKELTHRWYPTLSRSLAADRHNLKPLGSTHRALDDINASIRELRQYRANVFIPPPAPTEEEKEEVKRVVGGK
ncbi:ribonuclease H-like domain-containing protein [Mrakia frigida]|uniref:Rex2p n=1 Tax=Mrakia frigida TaxID=29902 RepID=UPI003FCC03AD